MINHLHLVWLLSFDGLFSSVTAAKSYGQNPGFLNPAFDPYGLFYNGWSHFGRQPAPVPGPAPAQAPSQAPASQTAVCGRGPVDFTIPAPPGAPPARSLVPTDRVLGADASAVSSVANPWPFLVSWFNLTHIALTELPKSTYNFDRALIKVSYYSNFVIKT